MRVLLWSGRFGTDARIWWSSTSMGPQNTSKACLYVFTTRNPKSHQRSRNYANASGGALGKPHDRRVQEWTRQVLRSGTIDGRVILVRNVWSDITPTSCRFEQPFSEDGGKTWEANWIATDTRLKEEPDGSSGATDARPGTQHASTEADGQHDFDFEIGTWKIHLSRLQERLAPRPGSILMAHP
ncbi:MAG: hypothetical protein QOJ42_6345 [Acidobacteriaceae bacterium]|nr:hypothetical protein [Acidobacteriaceae bacterium]